MEKQSQGQSLRLVQQQAQKSLIDLGDDDLMLLAKAGRHDAFETLVERHQELVLGLAVRYLGDRVAGRDVAQDVFLAIWSQRDRYQPQGRFQSYIVSVTIRRCHAVTRRKHCRGKYIADNDEARDREPATEGDEPWEALLEQERAREVRRCLTQLPEKQRRVMILRFTHDFPIAEIAETTGMPVGTVKSHLSRGLSRLRGTLRKGSLR